MDLESIVAALAALAQETRLRAFRLLVEAGPTGVAATDIADKLGVRQNLMSSHLAILRTAGLVRSRRQGRHILYTVDFESARAVVGFLVEDCCRGSSEKCGLLLDEILPVAARAAAS